MIPFSFLGPIVQRRFHRYLYPFLKERYFFSREIWNNLPAGNPKVFIRIDDFPYFDVPNEEFLRCHEVFEELGIPYLLGVTPFWEFEVGKLRELSKDDGQILKRCSPLCTIALHGSSHHPYPEFKIQDELDHYSESAVELLVKKTRDKFLGIGVQPPTALIVPFNTITKETAVIFARYFTHILTGPSALTTLGPRGLYENIGGAYHLPSFQPFYGSCSYMMKRLKVPFKWGKECYIPLTIHWGWERAEGYNTMRALLKMLRGRIASFDEVKVWLDRKFPMEVV